MWPCIPYYGGKKKKKKKKERVLVPEAAQSETNKKIKTKNSPPAISKVGDTGQLVYGTYITIF